MPERQPAIAYYRVSTVRQGQSGLGLEAQRAAVAAHLAQTREVLLAEYTEVESGRKNQRTQLLEALAQCRTTNAVLVIAKLDRLSRDAEFLIKLQKGDVEFRALDLPGATKFHLGIMALVAEHEADAISARTKAGLQALKARGVPSPRSTRREERVALGLGPLGWPANLTDAAREASARARRAAADERVAHVGGWAMDLRKEYGLSLQAIADQLTKRGEPPPRWIRRPADAAGHPPKDPRKTSGRWRVTQVVRLLAARRRWVAHHQIERARQRRRRH